jgi:hypothetical protein
MQHAFYMTATTIHKTTGTTKLQINNNELKIIIYFTLKISHLLHNLSINTTRCRKLLFQSAEYKTFSIPACMQREILYLVQ